MNVLITGATGFFGRAFIANHNLDIERLVVYSRDEAKQAAMMREFDRPEMRWMIGDVRDLQRLARAMKGVDVVIHCAALKRIQTGFYNPDELVKTNVIGTMNVIEAAIESNVSRVVFLSSDKAYRAVNAYGQSKALGESLILNAESLSGGNTTFACTRFGNVANSTGSVIPTWREVLKGPRSVNNRLPPVPVTDPECTRFFMTGEQAVSFVCETVTSNLPGVNIPTTLPAYRLGDLAEAMAGFDNMTISGLSEHEKLHESMSDDLCSETARRMSVEELREVIDAL